MLDFWREKLQACCLKNLYFFHISVVLCLKQASFSAVMVVSTHPSKTFFAIDGLVEFFTALEIPVSISPDPECFPKMPEKKSGQTTRNQTPKALPEFRKCQTKKIKFSYQNIVKLIYYNIHWAFLTFHFYLVPKGLLEEYQRSPKSKFAKQYIEVSVIDGFL